MEGQCHAAGCHSKRVRTDSNRCEDAQSRAMDIQWYACRHRNGWHQRSGAERICCPRYGIFANAGCVTVSIGTGTYTQQVSGNYLGSTSSLGSDGSGGTKVTLQIPGETRPSDLTGDGTSDILFLDPGNGTLGSFLMKNGQPTWAAIGWASPSMQVAGVGDFNGDGTTDILLRDPSGGGIDQFVMHSGQPTWAPIGWADPSLQVAGIGDFNGDGTADILLRNSATGAIGDFLMNNGQPSWAPVGWAVTNWQVAGAGDFNGDGTSDMLFRDPTTGAIGMFERIGTFEMTDNVAAWIPIGQADPSFQIAGVGDFNGDGTDDILLHDPTTGALGMFHMNNNVPSWVPIGATATNWQFAT